MGGFVRRLLHGQSHDPLGDRGVELRDARGPRLVAQKSVHAFAGKPFLPAPDAGLGFAGLAHDRVRPDALGAEQYGLRIGHNLNGFRLSYDFSGHRGEKEPLGEGGSPLGSGEGRIEQPLTV